MTSSSDSEPRTNEMPSEKLGDSSSELGGDSNSSEKLGEEEEKCGLRLFMKGGDCKDSFMAWEVCVEEADKNEENIIPKCMEVTRTLYKCMVDHSDYYQPYLTVEKAVREEQLKKEMEAEKNKEISEEELKWLAPS
ncbi:unnamed protein product [Eruca vesicaria subsp. sativa]|uniref:GCK domain-containing protein n=1 Tax=Eruca vesicaria subsp. sativa TaxID=29727 RepID=A0ABC8IWE8_ERUVS|nr:unnamed protein product [Eruca vesicaria subsp. sativa]